MLMVFIKAPRVGRVKTRLARELGEKQALEAYRTIVSKLFEQLQPVANVELRYTPANAQTEIAHWLREGWRSAPQDEGNLGARLMAVFAEKFEQQIKRVIVIGSDCPYIEPRDIRKAERALGDADVVLGPATDGGYWLIGLSEAQPRLFEDIAWSTERVLEQTLARAKELGLRVHLLRELEDIDTVASWNRFQSRREQQ